MHRLKFSLKLIVLLAIFSNLTLNISKTNSSEKVKNNFNYTDFEKTYILGPGDIIYIKFIGIESISGYYPIDGGGSMALPELGHFDARGKTLLETKNLLLEKYQEFIIDPKLNLFLTEHKPINIIMKGEVNRPGLYTLEFNKISTQKEEINSKNQIKDSISIFPKLFDGLQKGEGITLNADLSNIEVTRKNSESNGGGKIRAKINLLSLLEEGDLTQNISLRDGDIINVKRSEEILLDQLLKINKTNLAPKNVTVFVNGNIPIPGSKTLRQNSSLLQAIASAGGNSINTGSIEFIRLNRNGKSTKRTFKFDSSALKGSLRNPILISGDIIVVKKNIIAKSAEVIDTVARPILSSYGLYKLFD